jgi:hypothetical protein
MQNYNDEAKDQEKHGVHKYDHDHLLAWLDKHIKLPLICLLMVVSHYKENALGDDWSPYTHRPTPINKGTHGKRLDEVIAAADADLGERHLERLVSCLA